MGFILPPSPIDQARTLSLLKQSIESQLLTQLSILKTNNNSTLHSPLVTADGFPRDDIDVFAVRGARVRIIELRNDLRGVVDEIGRVLERLYDPEVQLAAASGVDVTRPVDRGPPKPFARVDGVALGSPAAEAGLQREDLIVKFGHLTHSSFTSSPTSTSPSPSPSSSSPTTSLEPLARLVAANENRLIHIKILRSNQPQPVILALTPRKGWGGRGTLGCHIVPYSAPSAAS